MSMTNRIALWATLASLVPAAPTLAQEDVDADAIDEIIVTAQRREQRLMDVPMSIAAWDAETLEQSAINNITLVSDITPGLVASGQTVTAGTVNFFIRGVGSNAGGDPAVGYYVDEIYVGAANAFNTSFVDLERVEILKGPQGTLWGRNTTGGAINIVTKRPSDELEGEVFVEVGDFGTFRTAGAFSGPLSDSLSGRLTIGIGQQDSFTQNVLSNRTDRTEESVAARGQLRFEPNDRLTVDLLYGVLADEHKNLFLFPTTNLPNTGSEFVFDFFDVPPNPDLYSIQLDEQPVSEYDGTEARLDVVFDVSDKYRLRWLTGINENDSFRRSDFDGNFLPLLNTTIDSEQKWTSSELQLQFSGERVNWTAGVYYYEQDADSLVIQDGDTDFFFMSSCQAPNFLLSQNPAAALCPLLNLFWTLNVPDIFFGTIPGFALPSLPWVTENFFGRTPISEDMGPGGTNPVLLAGLLPNLILGTGTEIGGGYGNLFDTGLITNQTSNADTESVSVYGEASFELSDSWTLTAGVRYTEDEKALTSEVLGTLFTPPLAPNSGADKREAWTPKVGLEWRPNDDALLYGTVTSGFKGSGFGALNNVTGQLTTFDEETVTSYEVGYKATLAGGKLRIDTSAYFYDYEDLQITLQFASGPITDNLDEVEVKGLDFAADWAPTDALNLGISFNLTDSEITKFSGTTVFDPTDFGAGSQNIEGNPLPRAPETSGNAYINYTFDLADNGFLTLGANASYTDDYNHSQFGNLLMTPSYTLTNANVAWSSPNGTFSVNLYGRNLSDEEYVHSSFFTDAFGVLLFPGAPRTYGLQFRMNY